MFLSELLDKLKYDELVYINIQGDQRARTVVLLFVSEIPFYLVRNRGPFIDIRVMAESSTYVVFLDQNFALDSPPQCYTGCNHLNFKRRTHGYQYIVIDVSRMSDFN